MSSQISSQLDTHPPSPNMSIQQIYKQNKMKDLALNKATNLIQLLNLQVPLSQQQLQVQRNSHKQNIRYLQQQLKQQYEIQIKQLKDKINILQQQRNNGPLSFSNQKTVRPSVFNRANSLKSLNHKNKTINKKYTQITNKNDDQIIKKQQQQTFFSNYCKYQMIQLNQWRSSISAQINQLIKIQYDELTTFINSIQVTTDEYDNLIDKKIEKRINLYQQISKLVKSQNRLINSLHAYIKQIDDINKSHIFKLNSLINQKYQQQKIDNIDIDQIKQDIFRVFKNNRGKLQSEIQQLNNQNVELKFITQSMIKLIQQQKKIKM